MACCAFAVFILGQLYLAFDAVSRRLGLTNRVSTRRSAADWRPGVQFATPRIKRKAWLPLRLALVLILSFGALGVAVAVAVQVSPASTDMRTLIEKPSNWCRSRLFREQ